MAALAAACTPGTLFEDGHQRALRIAGENGFQIARVAAGAFTLYSAYKGRRGEARRMTVYIEGDGNAWHNRFALSADPTPSEPIGLRLAVQDSAPLVVYLARPCQFTGTRDGSLCHPRYWASGRFAPEVIAATAAAIDHYKSLLGAEEVALVGYSGGGAVAALVAAERDDVVGLTTVVGNLDHAAWTAHHEVSPLRASLNPADAAARLSAVPQVHFAGGDDSVMPSLVARAFLARLTTPGQARLAVIEGFDHRCCWVRDWKALRARYPLP